MHNDPKQFSRKARFYGQGGWFERSDASGSDRPRHRHRSIRAGLEAAIGSGEPFALLDDQLLGRAQLLTEPLRVFEARTLAEVPGKLAEIREAIAAGATLFGYLSYRAGAAFETSVPRGLAPPPGFDAAPCVWFAEFASCSEGVFHPEAATVTAAAEHLVRRSDYEAMVAAAIEHIGAGDIYQVNLTFPSRLRIDDPLAYYLSARKRARAPFGTFLETGSRRLLSFSPELFFRISGGQVVARPMKGTRSRGRSPEADDRLAAALARSAKDRAENLMIVDLLRNDLSRICTAGSVKVPRLFDLEPYPTVWQMTSSVRGTLQPELGPVEALEALFPCGSITGAPKIMAMRIIAGLELFDRGVYTGAIGLMNRDSSVFNVAIRTIDHQDDMGRLDIGAGIVADSRPRSEWLECLAKARFATG